MIAAVLLLAVGIGGTIAFLTSSADPVTNTFTPAKVTCEVVETVENNIETGAKIKNTGNIDAYIRVAVVGNSVNADGNIIGQLDMSPYLAAAGWTEGADGYYYWGEKVAPGALTGELLTAQIELEGNMVSIFAEAIQAEGMAGVGNAQQAFAYAAANGGGNG